MGQVTYCELWSDQLHEPTGIMSQEDAHALDRQGEPYAVVLGAPTSPEAVVEVAWKNAHLGVWFIDENGRRHLHYSFTKVDDIRLFLSTITSWTYPDGAEFLFEASVVETVTFREDSYMRREIDDSSKNNVNVSEYSDVPIETNWEPVPTFGNWASVARYNREVATGT